MTEILDGGGLRAVGYLALGGLALLIAGRERRHPDRATGRLWPRYWVLTALVLFVVAVVQGGNLNELIADIGRSEARSAGWYDVRRGVQAVAVVAIGGAWVVGVVVAIWRVPPRRRRYLPSAIAVSALLAFIAVRGISLHQIDAIVYKSDLGGVRYVAVIEWCLLCVAAATMFARLDPERPRRISPAC